MEGASLIKPHQLMEKLPSLTRISFTVSSWCDCGHPMDLDKMVTPTLRKLTRIKIKFDRKDDEIGIHFVKGGLHITRDLSQLLGYCKNLSHLEIFTDNIVWLDPGRGTKSVKLPKLKHFVIYMGGHSWADAGSRRVLGTFIRKMLGRNKQKLSGWCRFPGIGKVKWSQEVKLGKILNVQSFRIQ